MDTNDQFYSTRRNEDTWTSNDNKALPTFDEGLDKKSLENSKESYSGVDSLKETTPKRLDKYWAIITSGAGLFSDGYVNNSIGTASTCLIRIYGAQYSESKAIQNVSSIAFAGTILGQLMFGYIADYHSRKFAMLAGTVILIVFSILASGSWGINTTNVHAGGLFTALTTYRFFIGIGIGSEYPASSSAAAEASNLLPEGKRNRWFCWFTNFMIDFGFVMSAFVAWLLLKICGEIHLTPVWRITLGLGSIPPLSLFFLRLKFKESERFEKTRFTKTIPYWRVIRFYWFRLSVISTIWFLYDFSAYAFGTYSSLILTYITGTDTSLATSFGWNVVFNLFYMPGAFLGAIASDYWGPRNTLAIGVTLQAIVGFIMAGCFEKLKKHIAVFTIIYGIFMTLGEFGPGDNIGCLASKTSATPIRGHYYAIAAAVGKVGAFVGTYIFPIIIRNAGGYDSVKGLQAPYWVASSLCCFSAFLAIVCLPRVTQDSMELEDRRFIEYLESIGYDISNLGIYDSSEVQPDERSVFFEVVDDSNKNGDVKSISKAI